jgi:hypothetical protein
MQPKRILIDRVPKLKLPAYHVDPRLTAAARVAPFKSIDLTYPAACRCHAQIQQTRDQKADKQLRLLNDNLVLMITYTCVLRVCY